MLEGVRDAQVVDAAKTCSVVDLPARYAACVIGVLRSSFSSILPIMTTASIFLSVDSRIMGRRLATGPLSFPSFWSGMRMS